MVRLVLWVCRNWPSPTLPSHGSQRLAFGEINENGLWSSAIPLQLPGFLIPEEHTEGQTKGNPSLFIMENHQLGVGE